MAVTEQAKSLQVFGRPGVHTTAKAASFPQVALGGRFRLSPPATLCWQPAGRNLMHAPRFNSQLAHQRVAQPIPERTSETIKPAVGGDHYRSDE